MRDVRIKEIDGNGVALVWEGDLLNIAEELLTEFDQPQTLAKFKLMMATYHRVGSVACAIWFIGKMNALKNGYTYKGEVFL